MRLLLIDSTQDYPANPLFLEALKDLAQTRGYKYDFVDEGKFFQVLDTSLTHKIAYRLLGRRPLTYWAFNKALLEKAHSFRPNILLVVKGAYISPNTLRSIKHTTDAILVNYMTDDPFNPVVSTRALVELIPFYDLCACTKRAVMDDVRKTGCRNVVYVPFGYKPSVHYPEKPETVEEKNRFISDVVFIGGCDRDRVPYFQTLVQVLPDVRINLYGAYWNRHPTLQLDSPHA